MTEGSIGTSTLTKRDALILFIGILVIGTFVLAAIGPELGLTPH